MGSSRVWRSLWSGLACGLEAVTFFLLIGVGLAALGDTLAHYLIAAKPIIAFILVGAGVAVLVDLSLPRPRWLRLGKTLTLQES